MTEQAGRTETNAGLQAPVMIADYDPRWPAMFEEERARILGSIGHRVLSIEHVGSTAVAGLAAKPIIDIGVTIRSLDEAPACVPPLARLGYEYVPEYEAQIPDRRYFRKGTPQARTHHLHMYEPASDQYVRHTLFRDYLRTHPETARQYEVLKRDLANRFPNDREAYTEAKTAFVESVLALARATAGRG
jgi:GrpB-like predicted nucleotidyltransferase (UPF0157 family)